MTSKKPLPKIQNPIFELELPSNGERIKYRTFTVKEEKILLIAQETNDIDQSILSIRQVVNNCLIDKSVDELSMFDLEYVLLTLRSKSVDNAVMFAIKDPDTGEKIELELDLNDVKVTKDESHNKEIRVTDDFVLYMRYPTINEFLDMMKASQDDTNANFAIMISCMDKLVGNDEVYKFSEFTPAEIEAFAEDLDSNAVKKIKHFFETMPTLRHEMKYKNKNGDEKTFVIEGMQTFFI
jgi:hypothetical protein